METSGELCLLTSIYRELLNRGESINVKFFRGNRFLDVNDN